MQSIKKQERKRKITKTRKNNEIIVIVQLDAILFQSRHDTVSTIYSMGNMIGGRRKSVSGQVRICKIKYKII